MRISDGFGFSCSPLFFQSTPEFSFQLVSVTNSGVQLVKTLVPLKSIPINPIINVIISNRLIFETSCVRLITEKLLKTITCEFLLYKGHQKSYDLYILNV